MLVESRLVCIETNQICIGSTTQPLSKRLAQHRSHFQAFVNGSGKICSSIKILEGNMYYIILIDIESLDELRVPDFFHIEQNDCVHIMKPSISPEEKNAGKIQYRVDNLAKTQQYRLDNKNKIKAQRKAYICMQK